MKKKFSRIFYVILFFCICFSCKRALASGSDEFVTIYWFSDTDQQNLFTTTQTIDLWADRVPEPMFLPEKEGYIFDGWYDVDSNMDLETENLTWKWLVEDKNGSGLKNVGVHGNRSLHFIPIWKENIQEIDPATPEPGVSTQPTPTSPDFTTTPTVTQTASLTPAITSSPVAENSPVSTTKPTPTPSATPKHSQKPVQVQTPSAGFVSPSPTKRPPHNSSVVETGSSEDIRFHAFSFLFHMVLLVALVYVFIQNNYKRR